MVDPTKKISIGFYQMVLPSSAQALELIKTGNVDNTTALSLEKPDGSDYQVPVGKKLWILLAISNQFGAYVIQADAADATTGQITKIPSFSVENTYHSVALVEIAAQKFVNMKFNGASTSINMRITALELDA